MRTVSFILLFTALLSFESNSQEVKTVLNNKTIIKSCFGVLINDTLRDPLHPKNGKYVTIQQEKIELHYLLYKNSAKNCIRKYNRYVLENVVELTTKNKNINSRTVTCPEATLAEIPTDPMLRPAYFNMSFDTCFNNSLYHSIIVTVLYNSGNGLVVKENVQTFNIDLKKDEWIKLGEVISAKTSKKLIKYIADEFHQKSFYVKSLGWSKKKTEKVIASNTDSTLKHFTLHKEYITFYLTDEDGNRSYSVPVKVPYKNFPGAFNAAFLNQLSND